MGKGIKVKIPRIKVYEVTPGKRYTIGVRYKNHNNKGTYSKGVTVYGDLNAVKEKAYELLAKQEKKNATEGQSPTIKELTEEFMRSRIALETVKATTIETDKYYIKRINQQLGNIKVKKLTKKDIENAIIKGKEENVSKRRIFRTFGKLKQILDIAERDDIIMKNPCKSILLRDEPKDAEKERKRTLTLEDIKKLEHLLYKAPKRYTFVAMYIALMTGMRRGEVLALQGKDYDVRNDLLYINKQLNTKRKITSTKTEKSNRIIVVSQRLKKYLKAGKIEQRNKARKKGLRINNETPIVTNENLTYAKPDNLERTGTRFYVKNGFGEYDKNGHYKGPTFHSLRSAHATLLFNNGAREKEIQERLGHSQITTTMDIYANVFNAVRKETAEKVDDFFNDDNGEYNNEEDDEGEDE